MTIALLVLCTTQTWGQSTIVLTDSTRPMMVGNRCALLEDPSRALTITQTVSPMYRAQFRYTSGESTPSLPVSASAQWARFVVANQCREACFFQLFAVGLDTVDVYISNGAGGFSHKQYGYGFSSERYAGLPSSVYQCVELTGIVTEPREIYVRMVSRYPIVMLAHVGTHSAMIDSNVFRSTVNGIFYGILAAMLGYNLFVFFSIRSRAYLYYLGYGIGAGMYLGYQTGALLELTGNQPALFIHEHLTTAALSWIILMVFFTISFLHTHKYSKKLHRTLQAFILFCLAAIALEYFGAIFPQALYISRFLINVDGIIIALLCLTAGGVVYWRGYRSARFYLIGWSFWLLSFSALILMVAGVLSATMLIVYFLQIGIASELVLMSFALADRINTLRREKEASLSENERLMREQNHALEYKVRERTAELEEANIELYDRNEELHRLDNEKNEFLGIVAHDLKNPLASIRMGAEMTIHYYEKLSDEEIQARLHSIESTVDRMNTIVENLLNVNAIETGLFTLDVTDVEMRGVLTEIVREYRGQAESKGIFFHLYLPHDDEVIVRTDKSAFYEVIENLVSNALKFSSSETAITISLSTDQVSCRVAVHDEGPGLSVSDQAKLFEKFSRLSARPTGGESSTGLGLSIVKKLVKALGGRVWCESELGKGATFVVELPIGVQK